jgi:hypothetical protein
MLLPRLDRGKYVHLPNQYAAPHRDHLAAAQRSPDLGVTDVDVGSSRRRHVEQLHRASMGGVSRPATALTVTCGQPDDFGQWATTFAAFTRRVVVACCLKWGKWRGGMARGRNLTLE